MFAEAVCLLTDVIRAKRVKFMDPESDCQPSTRPNEPSALFKPTRDLGCECPILNFHSLFCPISSILSGIHFD